MSDEWVPPPPRQQRLKRSLFSQDHVVYMGTGNMAIGEASASASATIAHAFRPAIPEESFLALRESIDTLALDVRVAVAEGNLDPDAAGIEIPADIRAEGVDLVRGFAKTSVDTTRAQNEQKLHRGNQWFAWGLEVGKAVLTAALAWALIYFFPPPTA